MRVKFLASPASKAWVVEVPARRKRRAVVATSPVVARAKEKCRISLSL